MRTFAEALAELRKETGLSQRGLSDKLGFSHSRIGMYESGERKPDFETLEIIADYFNVDMNYLLGKTTARNSYQPAITNEEMTAYSNLYQVNKVKLPLLGSIACGEPIYADEQRESYVLAGTSIKADFCLRCKGDSMINARIHDGDIVFIRKQSTVNNGEIAAVIIEDEATLKRLYFYPDQNLVILRPENPKYQDIVLSGEELNTVRVLGKAIAFQSDVM